jgi:hypothetical protein
MPTPARVRRLPIQGLARVLLQKVATDPNSNLHTLAFGLANWPVCAGSSVVEQLAFNQLVEGSTPSPRTTR